MPTKKTTILVVDDDASVRALLPVVLAQAGYRVQSAEDGLAALCAMRKEIPDVLLSDLEMPGMSGFELLSVVRRRFPELPVIAMSGAFYGDSIPDGIAADSFYDKGTNVRSLLQMVQAAAQQTRPSANQHPGPALPIWIAKNGHDPAGESYVTISCPECLRAFPQSLDEDLRAIHETDCAFCRATIHYAIVQSADSAATRKQPAVQQPSFLFHNGTMPGAPS
ncbi:MAG: response regulator [Acidobacteriaceae bacterium]